QNGQAPVLRLDTAKLNTDSVKLPSVTETVVEKHSMALPVAVTTEDRVKAMMREGINKNADWSDAIHYDIRRPSFVIIHHTSQHNILLTITTFHMEHTSAADHYVNAADWRVMQRLNGYLRA